MTTDEEDVRQRFRKIRQQASSLGLSGDDLALLDSLKSLRTPGRLQKLLPFLWSTLIWGAVGTLVLAFAFAVGWPVGRETYLRLWFNILGQDIEREPCIAELPDGLVDAVRPPVDCAMCRGVHSVDRVKSLTPELFEEKYAYSGVPVVITDGTANWTATKSFSFDFFKQIYAQDSPALLNIESHCQFFPYKTSFGSLGEVFNMSEERAQFKEGTLPWYIGWSNCDSSAANILRTHYDKPYFLPRIAESSKTDWIFMGCPGYGAHMHIDNVQHPSWQAQIAGTKLWVLEPPPECYLDCPARVEVTVNKGDIIVLNTNIWYHSTLILGEELSITIGSEYD